MNIRVEKTPRFQMDSRLRGNDSMGRHLWHDHLIAVTPLWVLNKTV